jgi:hypothetical protein
MRCALAGNRRTHDNTGLQMPEGSYLKSIWKQYFLTSQVIIFNFNNDNVKKRGNASAHGGECEDRKLTGNSWHPYKIIDAKEQVQRQTEKSRQSYERIWQREMCSLLILLLLVDLGRKDI